MAKAHRRVGGGGTPKLAKTRVQTAPLDDEWRRWVAENLLLGAPEDAVRSVLIARGCSADMAASEVAQALASPYLRGAALLQSRLAKRDWLLATYGRLAAIDGGLAVVPHQRGIDPAEFFRLYYAHHRPLLMEGAIDHWPAMARWSLAHFEAVLGDPVIQVQTKRDSSPDYESRSDLHRERIRFAEFAGRLRHTHPTNDFYLTANNNDENRAVFGPLWGDIGELPGILADDARDGGFLWIGPQGTITPFHHDLTNNLLIQVSGRKKVWLVPSWETPRMRNHLHCFSLHAGPSAIAALPPAERPAMMECIISPGDALFIPVGWWHHVEGLDMTIGLSFTQFARDNDYYSDYRNYGPL